MLMKDPMQGGARVHHIGASFDHLRNVPGIGLYGDRALLMPGTVVVAEGEQNTNGLFGEYLTFLRDVGIGANTVLRSKDLYDLPQSIQRRVRNAVMDGRDSWLQLFHTSGSEEEKRFIRALGISMADRVFNAPPAVSLDSNNKATLRTLGAELGRGNAFPDHAICRTEREVWNAVAAISQGRREVMLKRVDLASGDGMIRVPVRRQGNIRAIARPLLDGGGVVIVEDFCLNALPMSVQMECTDAGVFDTCATAQIIAEDGMRHLGNIIAAHDEGLPEFAETDAVTMYGIARPFAEHWQARGYRGVIGFDFIRAPDGTLYLLECNGRVTATTYAMSVGRQVHQRSAGQWGIAMEIVTPAAQIGDFRHLKRMLNGIIFKGLYGVLPFLVRLLPNKVGLMAVEPSARAACGALAEAKDRLAA